MEVLEIFDEAAKKVMLNLYPNYERIAADTMLPKVSEFRI